ncbi:MAG TPA: hypothetical protein VK335_16375 [Bryobacteraceae bacterium]|nr:hypothetical protein [Bryobacteraceae bacterium]
MESRNSEPISSSNNIELAKRCLALIRDIAGRGACSQDPENIGYALEELSQVWYERTGSDERLFEPIPADQIRGLRWLYEELDFVDGASQDMAASRHTCGFLCCWMHKLGFGLYRFQENRTS